jgi:hypothetical protein
MQSEIAPPIEPDGGPDLLAPVLGTLAQLNAALAACLEEIEALQERVAQLEAERIRPG